MTVERLILERVGIIRGALVAANLRVWIDASRSLGHFATAQEVADFYSKSLRTAKRRRSVIRSCFTEAEFRSLVHEGMVERGDLLQHEAKVA